MVFPCLLLSAGCRTEQWLVVPAPWKHASGGGPAGQTGTHSRAHTRSSGVSEDGCHSVLMGRWGPAELSEREASRPGRRGLKVGDPDLPPDSDNLPPHLGKGMVPGNV